MRLPEHESEGDNEELITKIVVDVQDPAAPIFEAARLNKGSHDTGRVITLLPRGRLLQRRSDQSELPSRLEH
jgi:hypothetical protein